MLDAKRFGRTYFLIALLACAGIATSHASAADGPQPPSNLRCEYLTNPIGIDVFQPRFSWVLEHSGRGEAQTAYQVLVATRAEALQKD